MRTEVENGMVYVMAGTEVVYALTLFEYGHLLGLRAAVEIERES